VIEMDRQQPTAVTAELTLRMVVDSQRTVAIPCSLEYRAEEPFAVRAIFRTGPADIEWSFARDLMIEGLQRPSGEGDVVMWPERQGPVPLLLIALNSPSGQAVLECESAHVEQFLRRTFQIVPLGDEGASLDIDATIAAILGEGLTAL
jgi:Streptomyces sporulation and cell division protein, SsgA